MEERRGSLASPTRPVEPAACSACAAGQMHAVLCCAQLSHLIMTCLFPRALPSSCFLASACRAKSLTAPTLDFSVSFAGYTPTTFGAAQKTAYVAALQTVMPGTPHPPCCYMLQPIVGLELSVGRGLAVCRALLRPAP